MNKFIVNTVVLSLFLLVGIVGFGQLTTVDLSIEKDSYIDTRYANTNYGTGITMSTSTYTVTASRGAPSQYHRRSYVECDLSSIPSNATIYSAKIKLKSTAAATGSFTWKTKLVTESWSEASIRAAYQPDISGLSADLATTTPSGTTNESIDVTNMVQRMVYGSADNYGWCIQVSNEAYSGVTGASFYTSDYSNTDYHPYLEVKYYTPLSVSSVVVSHETSTSADDGGVTYSISGGASSSYTYTWIDGATGTQISSSSSSSTIALSDRSYGWYGLHVTGSYGEELYQAFIIGLECEEVTIDFQPDKYFTENSYIVGLDRTAYGGTDYTTISNPDHAEIRAGRWLWSYWYSRRSFIDFNLWMDNSFTINQADLTLTGYAHHTAGGTNESQFDIVTESWNEDYLTWDNAPTTGTSTTVNIASTTSATQNNVVDLADFWEIWKADNTANYGVMLRTQNPNNAKKGQRYHSPAATTASQRPSIEFKLDLTKTNFLSTSWDPDTELGEVTVDISEVCTKTAPYFFFSTKDTIIDLDSLYGFVSDTIIGIDSLMFFGMTTTNLTKTYEKLAPGHYHFSAFDANGLRLFDQAVNIQVPITFDTQTGLTATGEEIEGTQANGKGSVEYYTHEELNTEISVQLTGTSGVQFFGFVDIGTTVTQYQDIQYGFYLNGTNLYTIDGGVLSGTSVTVSSASKLSMINNLGDLELLIDGSQHATRIVGADFEYKFGLQLQPANKIAWYHSGGVSFKKQYRFFGLKNSNFTCYKDGKIGFSIKKRGSTQSCTVSYSITGPGGFSVLNQTTTSSTPVTYFNNNGTPLEPGTYTISGQLNCAGTIIPFTEYVDLGYEVSWNMSTDYDLLPNNYSLRRQSALSPSYASARSNNMMPYHQDGWIEFDARNLVDNSVNVIRFTLTNLDEPVDGTIYDDVFIATMNFGGNYYLLMHDPLGNPTMPAPVVLLPYSKVKLEFTTIGGLNDKIKIYVDGQPVGELDRPISSNMVRCQSIKNPPLSPYAVGVENVMTSFGCRTSDNQYAELKYEMDGYYHIMQNGQISFIFNQEYDADNLTYTIYNMDDEAVKTDADFTALGTTNGPNYLTIDVSDDLDCIGRGYFYLEVINSKKEKMYLRFYNELSSAPTCPDYD